MIHAGTFWSIGSGAVGAAPAPSHSHRAEAWAASVHKHHRIVHRRHGRRLEWVTILALLALVLEVV